MDRHGKYLSALGAWALAFGCAVGWGSFVMPGNTFLPLAGPLGSALGLGLGAVVMLIIAVNYHFLMNRYPDAGGTYTYTKKSFGYDHGFLSAWFLILTYVAIIWANATALPRPDAKKIPIIALTANAFDEDVQRSLQAGMNAHLSKPVDSEHMLRLLGELVWKAEESE